MGWRFLAGPGGGVTFLRSEASCLAHERHGGSEDPAALALVYVGGFLFTAEQCAARAWELKARHVKGGEVVAQL